MQPNSVNLVGERGPELVTTGPSPVSVFNNESSRAAMAQYSPANEMAAPVGQPMNINVQTTSINGMEFITPEQFNEGMKQTASIASKQGEQRALNRLRQSRSARSKLGMQ